MSEYEEGFFWAVIVLLVVIVVVIVVILGSVFFGVIYLRAKSPHSRKISKEQAQLNRLSKKSADEVSGIETTSKKDVTWIKSTLMNVLIVVVGVGILLWLRGSDATSASVYTWAWRNILAVVIVWAIVHGLIAVNTKAEMPHKIVVGVMVFILFVLPVIGWIASFISPVKAVTVATPPPAAVCSRESPCRPQEGARVKIPEGKSVCFEKKFRDKLDTLGYQSSYQGEAGGKYADTFWFEPPEGARPPEYWFVPEGATKC
jgi:hypothetical protein